MRAEAALRAIFVADEEAGSPWLVPLCIGGLYVFGLVAWAYFFAWGNVGLNYHDWAEINIPRLTFLRDALRAGEWPLHMSHTSALHGVTDRFFALPDVITTPQTLLLLVMSIPSFVLVDVLLHYSLGMAGLLALRRHFRWSLFTLTVVFVIFMFNGHILSHYTVGHFTWGPYFLFPLVFLLLFRFLDGDSSWRLTAQFAGLVFYMVLAGGQHHATWVLILVALLVPFCWRRAGWLVTAAVASVLLSAVRLFPPALELGAYRQAGILTDVLGYPSTLHMLQSLVVLRREVPIDLGSLPGNLWFFDHNYWEFNFYVGAVGAIVLGLFGVYLWVRGPSPPYPELMVPAFAIVALSMGSVFRLARASGVPMFEGERITSRMLSLPLVLLMIMAGVFLDRKLRETQVALWHRLAAVSALVFMSIDAAAGIRLLRLQESSRLFGSVATDSTASLIAHRSDPEYVMVLSVGLVVTIATAIALVTLSIRERRSLAAAH